MWFIVNTERFKEKEAKELLETMDGVQDVYLPIYRKTFTDDNGKKTYRFCPTITGILFVNIRTTESKTEPETEDSPTLTGACNTLKNMVSSWGYFKYQQEVYDQDRGMNVTKTLYSSAHLLCFAIKDTPLPDIMRQACVPDTDLERFRIYNDSLTNAVEDLKIIDVPYSQMEEENDTVLITEGLFQNFEGIIKQVKQHGNKDRRLYCRIGNWSLSIPGVRNYHHVVVREAVRGMKARTVNTWRHIDQLTGSLQANGFTDTASRQLHTILEDLNHNATLTDYIATLKSTNPLRSFLEHLTPADEGSLISLSRYFQSKDSSVNRGLELMVPDTLLRPFLTPTPGKSIVKGKDYAILKHQDFTEVVLRKNLQDFFWKKKYEAGKYAPVSVEYTKVSKDDSNKEDSATKLVQIPDNDYLYYSHTALYPKPGGGMMALVNWGGFCQQYNNLSAEERQKFLEDLQKKEYFQLHKLLTDTTLTFAALPSNPTIGGFQMELPDATLKEDTDPMQNEAISVAVRKLTDTCAPSAVEMWQGTRLLYWRHLLQQHVLLHKIPVADRERGNKVYAGTQRPQ